MPVFPLCGCEMGKHKPELDRENPHEMTLSILLFRSSWSSIIIIIDRSLHEWIQNAGLKKSPLFCIIAYCFEWQLTIAWFNKGKIQSCVQATTVDSSLCGVDWYWNQISFSPHSLPLIHILTVPSTRGQHKGLHLYNNLGWRAGLRVSILLEGWGEKRSLLISEC